MRDLFFNETGVRTLAAGVHREWRAFDEKIVLSKPCWPGFPISA
jgi:hypothetical protein